MTPDPLAQLRDYHLPDPVPWWPPAPGWWILAGLTAVALLALAWLLRTRARRRAALIQARRELAALRAAHAAASDDLDLVRALSRLLRRFALARFPRRQVAGLSGDAWLEFLDRHGPEPGFRTGPGRSLIDAPYRPRAAVQTGELIRLVERWISANPGGRA